MQLAPSQVRADMKALGCVGQRSYGYAVSSLYKTIGDILQLSDRYSAVIVGGAPIAEAIKNSDNDVELAKIREKSLALCKKYPLYEG